MPSRLVTGTRAVEPKLGPIGCTTSVKFRKVILSDDERRQLEKNREHRERGLSLIDRLPFLTNKLAEVCWSD